MHITYHDTKRGIIKLIPETLDDLWHLSHVIEDNDILTSKTTRRIQDSTGEKLRSDRGYKKTFNLGIRVENVKFHKYTGKLRATGIIVHGPEEWVPLGSHHTLEIKLNQQLTISKEYWSPWILKRLKTAVKSSKKPSAIIVAIEDDEADLGIIRQYGVEYYGPIRGGISGKRMIDKKRSQNIEKFYQDVAETLQKFNDIQGIIIAGPGFAKGNFYEYLKDKYPDIAKIAIQESTGSGGRVGISEVLKKGIVERLATESRIAQEMRLINLILEEIGKSSNLVTYGKNQVKEAIEAGAVEKLLVIDELVRESDIERLLDLAQNMGGEITVISSEHEGGKQLKSLGGIAATLRYSLL